jgi:arginase
VAVKIHRDPKKIALIGVPTSAGSHGPGAEQAPAALRAAGLQARLEAAGFEVTDHGDTPVFLYQPDEEHPRARNAAVVVEALAALRAKVELAAKSGALLLILGGDCAITPGTIAGLRRYYREVGVFWMDRDADLNTPTSTPSGCIHGMTVAHLTGRGAPEIVRFSPDMPMVREPNLTLYGVERLDPPEEQFLATSLLRAYHAADVLRRGPAVTAREAVERIHGKQSPFVLHYDVDVISSPDFTACGFPAEGSLHAGHVREALEEVVAAPHLLAIELSEFLPSLDADGSAAKFLVELFAETLAGRLRVPAEIPTQVPTQEPAQVPAQAAAPAASPEPVGAPEVPTPSMPEPELISEGSPAADSEPMSPRLETSESGSGSEPPTIDASATSAGK